MRLRMYQVDAFASRVFRGNPAAVVPLSRWLDDAQLQAIAEENNLSETAFFVPQDEHFHLRWFTPTQEVPLCGHATLASAFIVFTVLETSSTAVRFETLSGILNVQRRAGNLLTMDFPRLIPKPCEPPALLLEGLRRSPVEVLATDTDTNYYAVYENEATVRAIGPNLSLLANLHPYGVVVTAVGDEADFVSRYFAPGYGIPEDPVTGSIHCALTPYWSQRLGKPVLHARQVSKRGGELQCEDLQGGVLISGQAVRFLEGELYI
jgi:PhzF family phenazine biosynthesis protein